MRHHLLSPEEPDELFRSLYQLCASYIEVRPLASGRSGAVSGEVSSLLPIYTSMVLFAALPTPKPPTVISAPQTSYPSVLRFPIHGTSVVLTSLILQVSLYPGPSYMLSASISSHSHLIPRDKALQYRLTDTGATFFERGTGGAVL